MGFVENVIFFVIVQNCDNRFIFDKVVTDYVMTCFYGPQCTMAITPFRVIQRSPILVPMEMSYATS